MSSSEIKFTEIQVTLDELSLWPDDYKKAIGELVITCGQWEHLYELLCKDLKITKGTDIVSSLQEAEGIKYQIKRIREALSAHTDSRCKELLGLIDELEGKYRSKRHLIVHGFHYIWKNKHQINQINQTKTTISEELVPQDLAKDAQNIHGLVTKLNALRKQVFLAPRSAIISTVSSAGVLVATKFPNKDLS